MADTVADGGAQVDTERLKLYVDCRNDLFKRQLSNSENFDRSILSLSIGLLAVSVAFIKPAAPAAQHIAVLGWSWVALGAAIGSTMASFMTSQAAIDRQLDHAEKYYLQGQDDFLTKPNRLGAATSWLNRLAGFAFLLGVALTIWFAIVNIPRGEAMPQKPTGTSSNFRTGGAPVPKMSAVTPSAVVERGAPIPTMQPVSATPAAAPAASGSVSGGSQVGPTGGGATSTSGSGNSGR
jgi:hypothetical protein